MDECVGELDECGVCNGPGAVLECGCSDIPKTDCDCDGNQFDAIGVCGGDCLEDLDQDGICDDVDRIEVLGSENDLKWSLFPNPSFDVVQLHFGLGQEPSELLLRDMRGRALNTAIIPSGTNQWTLDLTPLETGSYLLTWSVHGVAFSTPVHKINP